MIKGHVHEDANIIIGASNDQEVPEGAIKVSVIVTGIPKDFVVEKAETQQTIQPDIVITPATNRSDESNHVKQSEKEVGFLRRLFRNHW
ncbi:cell division protein FtsZ [compost metagenome]